MEYLGILIAFGIGILIGFLIKKSQTPNSNLLQNEVESARKQIQELIAQKSQIEGQYGLLRENFEKISIEHNQDREKLSYANERLARAEEAFKAQENKIREQQIEFEKLNERFQKEFELVAGRLLRQNTEEISKINNQKLEDTLKPLKERIKVFEEKIDQSGKDNKGLKDQIELLHKLNQKMAEEAQNLTKALKGDVKKQGNWGELILEKIIESSGLEKGREYVTQYSTKNEEGGRLYPDVVINLPENKHIIIDSKVSLISYEAYINEADEEKKSTHLKAFITSTRNHIKGLSEKNYQELMSLNSVDFVLLFMPMESAFSLAIQNDEDIFQFAWDKKIVIVSPTTLLATLRTIASIWKQERQTKNAQEIARQGAALYDKFVGFVEDLQKIGTQINATQKTYDTAIGKLKDGSGNLISRAEKLKELGLKTTKNIDENLI